MAQFLRATMMRWEDERQSLIPQVRKTIDADALTRAAFDVAVRRRFTPDTDLRQIGRFVTALRTAFGNDVPVLEIEALIREALGEPVTTNDIDLRTEILAKTLTLGGIKDVLFWEKADVDEVLVEAEALAAERGFHPTLAKP